MKQFVSEVSVWMAYAHLVIAIVATGRSFVPSENSKHAQMVALVGFVGAATFKYFSN
jgi:hypothetical protein